MTTEANSELVPAVETAALAKLAKPMLSNTAAALAARAARELTDAKQLPAITTDTEYEIIVDRGKNLARLVAALEEDRVSVTKPLLDLKRAWDGVFKPAIDSGESALGIYRRLLGDYQRLREQRRRQAIEDAARKQRDEENKRREELRLQEEAARAELAAAVKAGDAEKVSEAVHAVDEAVSDAAAPIATVVAPVFVAPAPRATGTSTRKTFKWRFRDGGETALRIAAVAAFEKGDRSLLPLIGINESEIGKRVRALGEHANIPGVEVYEDTTVALSRRGA